MENHFGKKIILFVKQLLICIVFLLIKYSCYSQVSFGIKSGINIATTKDINSDPKNRVGWYTGSFAQITLSKKIFLQPELLFSTKGYRYIGNLNESKKTALRLNYSNYSVAKKSVVVLCFKKSESYAQ